MKIKKSIHYDSASINVASNTTLNNSGTRILKSPKYDIQKTLKYILPNGIKFTYYLDSKGNCVYWCPFDMETIGELDETTEGVTVSPV